MPRKSHADYIIEELEHLEDAEGPYLVIYDFARKAGKPTHHGFFENLDRIFSKLGDGRRVQFSVIECNRLRTARAVELLTKRFHVRDVAVYKVEKMPPLGVGEP